MDTRDAIWQVIEEEATRQNRRLGEVSRSAGIGKNTLYKVKGGATLTAPTLWDVAAALRVPMHEIAFRVDQRRSGRVTEPSK